jgi:hypothetical protein
MVIYILIVFGFLLSGGNLFYKKKPDEYDFYEPDNQPDNPKPDDKSDGTGINPADSNIGDKYPKDDNTGYRDLK